MSSLAACKDVKIGMILRGNFRFYDDNPKKRMCNVLLIMSKNKTYIKNTINE